MSYELIVGAARLGVPFQARDGSGRRRPMQEVLAPGVVVARRRAVAWARRRRPLSPLPSPRSVADPATAVAGTAAAKRRRKKDRKGKGAGLATLAASSVAAQTDVQRQAEGQRLADALGQRDGVADFSDFDEAERQLADVRALLLAGELSRASRSQLQGAETVLLVRLAHALERGWRPRAPSARG